MILLINQTPVDFTLTDEKTLGDLETALRAWAAAEDQVVVSLLADGRSPAEGDRTPLETVRTVEAEVSDRDEAARLQAGVVADYLELLAQAAGRNDSAALEDLRRDWPSVRQALGDRAGALDDAGTAPGALARAAAAEASWWREASAPPRPLEDCVAALEAAAPELEALGTLFHQGKDREALEQLDRLFAGLGALGRSASGPEWTGWRQELEPFLGEIEASLAARDFVLTADLLEYEVKPRLEELRARLGL